MQLLAFEQTPADAPAQLRIAEVVEDYVELSLSREIEQQKPNIWAPELKSPPLPPSSIHYVRVISAS
jgi:hypothetical protein